MSIVMQINPFDYFADLKGDALDEGYIWIGQPNKDPRQFPVAVYFDAALTIPAAQPLRTNAGYIVRGNAPTFLYINGNYSVLVEDKKHRRVFYVADFLLTGNSGAVSIGDLMNTDDPLKGDNLVGFKQPSAGAIASTVHNKLLQYSSPQDYGAKADGVTDDTAAINLAIVACAAENKILVFTNGIYRARRIALQSNITIRGNGGMIQPLSGDFVATSGLHNTALFEGSNLTNVDIRDLEVTYANSADRCGIFLFDTCSHVKVYNCAMEVSAGRGIYSRLVTDCDFSYNTFRLGRSGAYGVAIHFIHNSRRCKANFNDIQGYLVTQGAAGSGIQPPGDLWGSVGIACNITDSFLVAYNGWNYKTGSYTILSPAGTSPSSVTVAVPGVAADGLWEAAGGHDVSATTGYQKPTKIGAVLGTDTLTLSQLPINNPGQIVNWAILGYGNSPRYMEFSNNTIRGMIFAGISLITARDVTACNNYMESIGDIGWDPEGTQRCNLVGGTIIDCTSAGAILAGFKSSVLGTSFQRCGNRSARVVGPNIAYNYAVIGDAVLPYGLKGENRIIGCTMDGSLISITTDSKCMAVTIAGNAITTAIRAIECVSGCDMHVIGNDVTGNIKMTDVQEFEVSNNTVRDPQQNAIWLVGASKFSVKDNTVMRTTGQFAGGSGVRYGTSTSGIIKNNTYISIAAAGEIDDGGNTLVTVSGSVTL